MRGGRPGTGCLEYYHPPAQRSSMGTRLMPWGPPFQKPLLCPLPPWFSWAVSSHDLDQALAALHQQHSVRSPGRWPLLGCTSETQKRKTQTQGFKTQTKTQARFKTQPKRKTTNCDTFFKTQPKRKTQTQPKRTKRKRNQNANAPNANANATKTQIPSTSGARRSSHTSASIPWAEKECQRSLAGAKPDLWLGASRT